MSSRCEREREWRCKDEVVAGSDDRAPGLIVIGVAYQGHDLGELGVVTQSVEQDCKAGATLRSWVVLASMQGMRVRQKKVRQKRSSSWFAGSELAKAS